MEGKETLAVGFQPTVEGRAGGVERAMLDSRSGAGFRLGHGLRPPTLETRGKAGMGIPQKGDSEGWRHGGAKIQPDGECVYSARRMGWARGAQVA